MRRACQRHLGLRDNRAVDGDYRGTVELLVVAADAPTRHEPPPRFRTSTPCSSPAPAPPAPGAHVRGESVGAGRVCQATSGPEVLGPALAVTHAVRSSAAACTATAPTWANRPSCTLSRGPQMLSTASGRPVRSSTGADTP